MGSPGGETPKTEVGGPLLWASAGLQLSPRVLPLLPYLILYPLPASSGHALPPLVPNPANALSFISGAAYLI